MTAMSNLIDRFSQLTGFGETGCLGVNAASAVEQVSVRVYAGAMTLLVTTAESVVEALRPRRIRASVT